MSEVHINLTRSSSSTRRKVKSSLTGRRPSGNGARKISAESERTPNRFLSFDRRVTRKKNVKTEELYVFASQLSTLLESGVPLVSSLGILAQQTDNKDFRSIIEQIKEDINGGSTLTRAMAKYPDIFSKLFLSMIRTAEKGGRMVVVLHQLSSYLEKQDKLSKKIKAAIVYPRFVFFFFVAVLAGIIFGLVPKFRDIFESFNADLPVPTQVLIAISEFAKNHFVEEVAVLAVLIIGYQQFRKTETGRYFLDRQKLQLPLIGDMILKSSMSKFCRTLGVLLKSGVSLVDSLRIAGETAENVHISESVDAIKQGVIEGKSLHSGLGREPIFPLLLVKMVSVGEQSGSLDTMLTRMAEIYDDDVDARVSGLTSIIEPALMVGLGIAALVVIIALYLPIFKMSSVIAQ